MKVTTGKTRSELHVAYVDEIRKPCKILVGNPDTESSLGKTMSSIWITLKWILEDMRLHCVECFDVDQDRFHWRGFCGHGNKPADGMKRDTF